MFDHYRCRLLTKGMDELPRCLGVKHVEIAHGLAVVLHGIVPPTALTGESVAGANLMRVLAVAEILDAFGCQVYRLRQWIFVNRVVGRVEPLDDRRVVGRGVGKGLASQPTFGRRGEFTSRDFLGYSVVVIWIDNDADELMILRGRSHHRRAANVDEFDPGVGAEGIQIYDDQVDRCDVVGFQIGLMFRVVAVGQDSAVNLWMKRHHPMTEHDRRSGVIGNVGDRQAGIGDHLGGAAAGEQRPTCVDERRGQFGDPGLVEYG